MAKEGILPFATTYAAFTAWHAYDFVYLAIAVEDLDIKICFVPVVDQCAVR